MRGKLPQVRPRSAKNEVDLRGDTKLLPDRNKSNRIPRLVRKFRPVSLILMSASMVVILRDARTIKFWILIVQIRIIRKFEIVEI